jgi:hypothetical protein
MSKRHVLAPVGPRSCSPPTATSLPRTMTRPFREAHLLADLPHLVPRNVAQHRRNELLRIGIADAAG